MYGIMLFKKYRMGHGCVSTLQVQSFRGLPVPVRYALAVISTAAVLNCLAIKFLPNQEGMGPKDRLVQFLLPSVGFSVSFWAFVASKLAKYMEDHHADSRHTGESMV